MNHARFVLVLGVAASLGAAAHAQKFDNRQRDDAREMLDNIAQDVKKYYYDSKLHGFDFDARVREVDEKLKSATSLSQAFSLIGWALDGLNDSHTYFIPPRRTYRLDYGWQMQMVGDHCYVTRVRPDSDAGSKGLKPGDEVLSVNGISPTRDNFPTMQYIYRILAPRRVMRLVLRGLDGQQRQLDVEGKGRQLKKLVDLAGSGGGFDLWDLIREYENADRLSRTKCVEMGDELAICKIPEFNLDADHARNLISLARKHKNLILDLRDNPGGYADSLTHLIGGFFDHEIKIADRVGRKEMKPQMGKAYHEPFSGKVVVLVDSESASAAELFARVVQLEKRGTVIGDRTLGLVMEARGYDHKLGVTTEAYYAAAITDADLIMKDGVSLEHRGVIPDEVLLPTAADLNTGSDRVLARAAERLGVALTPEKAGKLFPYEWPKL